MKRFGLEDFKARQTTIYSLENVICIDKVDIDANYKKIISNLRGKLTDYEVVYFTEL